MIFSLLNINVYKKCIDSLLKLLFLSGELALSRNVHGKLYFYSETRYFVLCHLRLIIRV